MLIPPPVDPVLRPPGAVTFLGRRPIQVQGELPLRDPEAEFVENRAAGRSVHSHWAYIHHANVSYGSVYIACATDVLMDRCEQGPSNV